MRKTSAILFLMYYLILIIGMQVSIHYCMGEIEAVSIVTENTSCCCDSEGITDECCHNDQILLQFQPEEQLEASFSYNFHFQVKEVRGFFSMTEQVEREDDFTFIGSFKSPPIDITPLWLKFSSLTYYG